MKKLVTLLTIAITLFLTSCSHNLKGFRTKTLKNGDIITFYVTEEKAKFYQPGDTITIKLFGDYDETWEIVNGPRMKDETGITEIWYTSDSLMVGNNFYSYKNVVIEDIFDKK